MKVSKWYRVLVVGSATVLSAGCGSTENKALDVGTDGASDTEPTQSAPASSDASVLLDAEPVVDATPADAAPADASTADAGSSADATAPICSEGGDPADPCGCPCCWAVGFLNTDPECAGFCSAGNGGAGCCSE